MSRFIRLILESDAAKKRAELAGPAPQPIPDPEEDESEQKVQPKVRPRRRLWAGMDSPGLRMGNSGENS